MAKTKRTRGKITRRQIARRKKDSQQQKVLIWIAVIVSVTILAITVYGAITETLKARRPVARVGEVMITITDFKIRQYYERWMARLQVYSYQELLNQVQVLDTEPDDGIETPIESSENAYVQQLQLNISNLESQLSEDLSSFFAGQVLDTMIEEELVRQEAAVRGLTVSEEDVDLTIEEFMGFGASSVTVTDTLATPDPQEVEETLGQFKTNVLEPSRFTEDEFRTMIRTGLLRAQLKEILGENVALVEDQVQITLLVVTTEEDGNALTTRINDGGEDVGAIITELTEDDEDNSYGYEAPWLPLGYLGSQLSMDIERVAFNTPPGRASEPILGPEDSYYVIYVNGHEEQPLSDDLLYQTRAQEYNNWLIKQTEEQTEYLAGQDAILIRP